MPTAKFCHIYCTICVLMHNIFFHLIYEFANCTVVHLHPGCQNGLLFLPIRSKERGKNIWVLYLGIATVIVLRLRTCSGWAAGNVKQAQCFYTNKRKTQLSLLAWCSAWTAEHYHVAVNKCWVIHSCNICKSQKALWSWINVITHGWGGVSSREQYIDLPVVSVAAQDVGTGLTSFNPLIRVSLWSSCIGVRALGSLHTSSR